LEEGGEIMKLANENTTEGFVCGLVCVGVCALYCQADSPIIPVMDVAGAAAGYTLGYEK